MLCVPGLDRKSYQNQLAQAFPEVWCPSCLDCLLRAHGWYRRFLDDELFDIRRGRCPHCRVTHALLPEDVCAYRDLTLPALERAMEASGPKAAARAVGETDDAAVRRARRWWRSPGWKQLEALLPAEGTVEERIVAIVGPAPGKLIRLRHWLWKTLLYFLSGASRLFRHGCPGRRLRDDST